jgi:hypothetical protein
LPSRVCSFTASTVWQQHLRALRSRLHVTVRFLDVIYVTLCGCLVTVPFRYPRFVATHLICRLCLCIVLHHCHSLSAFHLPFCCCHSAGYRRRWFAGYHDCHSPFVLPRGWFNVRYHHCTVAVDGLFVHSSRRYHLRLRLVVRWFTWTAAYRFLLRYRGSFRLLVASPLVYRLYPIPWCRLL